LISNHIIWKKICFSTQNKKVHGKFTAASNSDLPFIAVGAAIGRPPNIYYANIGIFEENHI